MGFEIYCNKCNSRNVVVHTTAIKYGTICRVGMRCRKCGNKQELEPPRLKNVSLEEFENGPETSSKEKEKERQTTG